MNKIFLFFNLAGMKILEAYKSKDQRIKTHLFFWLFMLIFQVSRYQMNFTGYTFQTFIDNFIEEIVFVLFVHIPASYFTAYILLDKYYFKKKFTQFWVYLAISISFFVLLLRII